MKSGTSFQQIQLWFEQKEVSEELQFWSDQAEEIPQHERMNHVNCYDGACLLDFGKLDASRLPDLCVVRAQRSKILKDKGASVLLHKLEYPVFIDDLKSEGLWVIEVTGPFF